MALLKKQITSLETDYKRTETTWIVRKRVQNYCHKDAQWIKQSKNRQVNKIRKQYMNKMRIWIQTMNKNQTEILELKNTTTELKIH